MKPLPHWTVEQLLELKELKDKFTKKEIALKLNRPLNQVILAIRCRLRGKKDPRWSDIHVVRQISRYAKEHGNRAAAEKYNTTVDSIKWSNKRARNDRDRRKKETSVDEIESFRKIAKKYATARDYAQYADDFGSYVTLQRMTSDRMTSMENYFTDFKRETFGSTRTGSGKLEATANRFYSEVDNEAPEEKEKETPECHLWEEHGAKVALSEKEKIIFILTYKWKFTLKEIAYLYGQSESMLSLLLVGIHDKIRRHKRRTETKL